MENGNVMDAGSGSVGVNVGGGDFEQRFKEMVQNGGGVSGVEPPKKKLDWRIVLIVVMGVLLIGIIVWWAVVTVGGDGGSVPTASNDGEGIIGKWDCKNNWSIEFKEDGRYSLSAPAYTSNGSFTYVDGRLDMRGGMLDVLGEEMSGELNFKSRRVVLDSNEMILVDDDEAAIVCEEVSL